MGLPHRGDELARAQRAFFDVSLDEALTHHERVPPGETALALFRDVAATVPAYERLLRARGIDASAIRSPEDFARLPLLTKKSYLAGSSLADVCRGGRLASCDTVAVSSGSTGEPTFWPRFVTDELAIARRFEQIFVDSFAADRKSTLAVVCFPLGTWVGGLYTTACVRHLAQKGLPLLVVAPGNVKEEILRVVSALRGELEQCVLLGYPPFLKDVVDTGRARGFDWGKVPTKLVLAGEVVSESWRTLLAERLGGTSPLFDFASLYGTADAGVLANETPLSIAMRRFLAERPADAEAIFGESRLPTLAQYDPSSRYFEVVDGTLLFTGDGGAPLVRYHIADRGGLHAYEDLLDRVTALGFDLRALERAGAKVRRLPFVHVFGRADFTVSFFGANVFPENVTVGLERSGVSEHVTGKFVLESREDQDRDRSLWLAVELAPGQLASDDLAARVGDAVRVALLHQNSEFRAYVPVDKQVPTVELFAHGDPTWFPVGVKHRYTRKGKI
jgi:phenylacetate-CoA ligase